MRKPKLNQRVRVLKGPAAGITGVVTSMLFRSEPASWVRLDERVEACPFPADDERRKNNLLVNWSDMEAK